MATWKKTCAFSIHTTCACDVVNCWWLLNLCEQLDPYGHMKIKKVFKKCSRNIRGRSKWVMLLANICIYLCLHTFCKSHLQCVQGRWHFMQGCARDVCCKTDRLVLLNFISLTNGASQLSCSPPKQKSKVSKKPWLWTRCRSSFMSSLVWTKDIAIQSTPALQANSMSFLSSKKRLGFNVTQSHEELGVATTNMIKKTNRPNLLQLMRSQS